jgi:hypothetical protein
MRGRRDPHLPAAAHTGAVGIVVSVVGLDFDMIMRDQLL